MVPLNTPAASGLPSAGRSETIDRMECLGFPIIFVLLFFVIAKSSRRPREQCSFCGERNPARANYCRRCGASLSR
jgi:ribosomal protein L40E